MLAVLVLPPYHIHILGYQLFVGLGGLLTLRSWHQYGSVCFETESHVSQDGPKHYVDNNVLPSLILLPLSPKCKIV